MKTKTWGLVQGKYSAAELPGAQPGGKFRLEAKEEISEVARVSPRKKKNKKSDLVTVSGRLIGTA